jgi:hypothetical protein
MDWDRRLDGAHGTPYLVELPSTLLLAAAAIMPLMKHTADPSIDTRPRDSKKKTGKFNFTTG